MNETSQAEVIISVRNVNKIFRLPHEKANSIKSLLINFRKRRTYEKQRVLNDITFDIKKGEFFGIVGRNGSGKSTLLKLLAGIYTASAGSIAVHGQLTPFIELGVGFNPELTGRENVFLNGALLGFNRKEMAKMYKDIVDFAELGRFMDQKLKNYSSGMQVRLAFSIAIRAKSDILLIDEVLAVGDLDFQKKCFNYFYDLKKKGQTVVLVTHDMSAIRKFCTRAVLINDGELLKVGSPEVVAGAYETINLRAAEGRLASKDKDIELPKREGTREATVQKVETFNEKTGKAQNTFTPDEKVGVRMVCIAHRAIDSPSLGFIFQDQQDSTVFATNNWVTNQKTRTVAKGEKIILETVVDNVFTDGEYTITCAIESEDFLTVFDRIKYIHKFMIGGHELAHAKVHPHYNMEVSYSNGKKKA